MTHWKNSLKIYEANSKKSEKESMKISVLDAKTLGDDLDLSPFEQFGELQIYDYTEPEKVSENISDSDIIIINKIKINESNIKHAKNLRLICEMATGYDNIDLSSEKFIR